jgi:hypothetical protein
MSQIAPDIPELAHIPEVIRPFLWTRATVRAAGSMTIQLGGLVFFGVCTAAGVYVGWRTLDAFGAFAGGLVGGGSAMSVFFKLFLPWQARRFLSLVEKEGDWATEFADVIRAHDRLQALIAQAKD